MNSEPKDVERVGFDSLSESMKEFNAKARRAQRIAAHGEELRHTLACIVAYIDAGQIVERDGMSSLMDSQTVTKARDLLAKIEGDA